VDLQAHDSIIPSPDRQKCNISKEKTDSVFIDIASGNTSKNILLIVVYASLIRWYCQTAVRKALHESMDGPAGQSADNLPDSDTLLADHQTEPEFTVRIY
jgi:hypothetical protein